MDAAPRRGVAQVRLLGGDQRLPHRDRTAAGPQLLAELQVEALSILDEIGIAVLVAGPADQGRVLPGKSLRKVRLGDRDGQRIAVHRVVSGVAALTEDDDVRPIEGGIRDFRGEQAGREIRSLGAEGAEVGPEEDQIVAAPEELRAQLVRGPGTAGNRGRTARLDQGVGWMAGPGGELAGDGLRPVSKKVVAGGEA